MRLVPTIFPVPHSGITEMVSVFPVDDLHHDYDASRNLGPPGFARAPLGCILHTDR